MVVSILINMSMVFIYTKMCKYTIGWVIKNGEKFPAWNLSPAKKKKKKKRYKFHGMRIKIRDRTTP